MQQWAWRFAAEASLLDRARTGRPVTRVTGRMVNSIRRLVKDKWRQSTRRTAATLRARGTPISHCTVWRALKDDGPPSTDKNKGVTYETLYMYI